MCEIFVLGGMAKGHEQVLHSAIGSLLYTPDCTDPICLFIITVDWLISACAYSNKWKGSMRLIKDMCLYT